MVGTPATGSTDISRLLPLGIDPEITVQRHGRLEELLAGTVADHPEDVAREPTVSVGLSLHFGHDVFDRPAVAFGPIKGDRRTGAARPPGAVDQHGPAIGIVAGLENLAELELL